KFQSQFASDGRQVGELEPTGLRPKFAEKLIASGIDLPAKMFQRQAKSSAVRIGAVARPGMLSRGRR
ncbi:MAG: hypothetical protein ACXVQW_12590, partial [Actinomycetota bacterium]